MPKRLLALNLLLLLASAASAVPLVRVLSTARSVPPPPASIAAQPGVPPKDDQAKEDTRPARPALGTFAGVTTRNLFNPNRSDEVTTPAPGVPAVKPLLHGVVINDDFRRAYLEDPTTKRVFGFKQGDTVAGGQVEQIEENRVVIKRPDGLLEIKLKDPTKPKPPPPAPPRVATPVPVRPQAVLPGPVVTPRAPAVTPPVPGARPPVTPGMLRRSFPGRPPAPPPSQSQGE